MRGLAVALVTEPCAITAHDLQALRGIVQRLGKPQCVVDALLHLRPSVSDLRLGLLDPAGDHPDCMAAVQSALGLLDEGGARGLEDVGRVSAECIPYLTDLVRACGAPLAVGLLTAASL